MLGKRKERRKSVRVQIRMTVHVELMGQPRFYEAVSRDLSVGGACLVLRKHLPHCTSVYLEFRLPGSLETLYSPAHVVWSHQAPTASKGEEGGGEMFLMGVEFVRPPRNVRKEVKRFVAERLKEEKGRARR